MRKVEETMGCGFAEGFVHTYLYKSWYFRPFIIEKYIPGSLFGTSYTWVEQVDMVPIPREHMPHS